LNALDPAELSPNDVLRYIIEATRLERLAMGEPETVQEDRHKGGDGDKALDQMLASLRVEELRQLRAIADRLGGAQPHGAAPAPPPPPPVVSPPHALHPPPRAPRVPPPPPPPPPRRPLPRAPAHPGRCPSPLPPPLLWPCPPRRSRSCRPPATSGGRPSHAFP